MRTNAVILLSGGLDSATVLAIAKERNFDCFALSFHYGQRHYMELKAAFDVATALGVQKHQVVNIDMSWVKGTALIDKTIDLPTVATAGIIPVTYVPARNTIFLSYALAFAESVGAADIFAGMNAVDYSGYPDCRPEYVSAFQAMARLGTKTGNLTIHSPLIEMSKADIIREGTRLNVPYAVTLSCYGPTGTTPCGMCDSCRIRAAGFAEAGIADPSLS